MKNPPHARLTRRKLASAVASALIAGFAPATSHALPEGGQVTGGAAEFQRSGANLTINQGTERAAINWQSFGIAPNEAVRFNQPSASSITLNRVLGQNPSQVFGSLSANGQVFLLNPNGILFAPGAQVNVGGLVASTLGLSDADFFAGRHTFSGDGTAGSVVNRGTITAANGGYVALMGPNVRNEGVVTAQLGTVALAAGNQVTLNLNGTSLVSFAVDRGALDALVENRQIIRADGGQVILTAKAADTLARSVVNNSGIVEARTVSNVDGVVRLEGGSVTNSGTLATPGGGSTSIRAAQDVTLESTSVITASGTRAGTVSIRAEKGTLSADGRIEAQGTEAAGGTIRLLGERVGVVNQAAIDASGRGGGGTVLVGGDYQGRNPQVQNASRTYVGPDATIRADATEAGNGGKVVVWADDITRYHGSASARGGSRSGDGGLVETSGKNFLDVNGGRVDTRASNGRVGTWLLDPTNIQVIAAGANAIAAQVDQFADPDQGGAGNSKVDPATLNAAGANVVLQAQNDITVTDAINLTATANANLTLQAGRSIAVNHSVATNGTGNITMVANNVDNTETNAAGNALTGSGGTNRGASAATLTLAGAVSTGAGGSIKLVNSATAANGGATGAITLNANVATGNASIADATGNQTPRSGNITLSAGTNVTGTGRLITGTAAITGANVSGTDVATTGSISVTAGAGGVSGGIGLSAANALTVGAATRTGATADTATAGSVTLVSRDEINNSTASTALSVTLGTASGASTNNAGALSATTSTAAGNAFLTAAGPLRFGASTVAGNLNATSAGAITQSGGIAVTGTSSFSAAANPITLTNTGNNFTGAVSAANSGANAIQITDVNALQLGTVSTANTLTVNAGGSVTQASGAVAANTLVATLTGASSELNLGTASNNVTTIGTITAPAGFTLANGDNATTIVGTITTSGGNGPVSISTGSGGYTQNNFDIIAGSGAITITADAVTIAANSSNNAFRTTGVLTLKPATAGTAMSFAGASAFDLSAAEVTALAGGVTGAGSITIGDAAASTGTLTIGGAVNFGARTVTLNAGALIDGNSTGRTVTAQSLNLNARNAGGGIGAAGGNNAIDVAVTNLTVNTNNGGAFVTDTGTLNFGPGTSHVGTGAIGVIATGAITQSGAITQAAGGGAVSFSAGANPITLTNLGNDFTGAVSLNNSGTGSVAITDSNAIVLGTSSVGTGTFAVTTMGPNSITQTGAITQGANAGAASFTTGAGVITLTQANEFTGPVSATNTGANAIQISDATALRLGTVSTDYALTLNAGGSVTQTGAVSADTLSATLTGASSQLNLGTASNNVTNIGPVTAPGGFTLANGNNATTVVGTITTSGGNGAVSINTGSGGYTQNDFDIIAGSGAITITADTVAIAANSASNAFQTTGVLTLKPATAGTAMSLAGVSAFDLSATEVMDLTGGVSGAGSIVIGNAAASTGTLTIGGAVSFGSRTVTLNAGDFTDANTTGRTISAQSLNLNARNAGGSIGAGGADNAIDVAVTNLRFNTSNADAFINATGALNFGSGTSSVGTGAIGVTATGAITQSGAITQATGGGAVSFSASANPITLTAAGNNFTGAVSAANSGTNTIQITDVNAMQLGTVSTENTLTLNAGGSVTQSGTVTANRLVATLTGASSQLDLGSASNNLANIGAITAPGGFTLTNGNNPTTVVGNITTSGGNGPVSINIGSNSYTQNNFDIVAGSGAITVTADALTIATNTSNNAFQTTGVLTLKPATAGTPMSLASFLAFDLSATEVTSVAGGVTGAGSIVIGDAAASTGTMIIGGAVNFGARTVTLNAGTYTDGNTTGRTVTAQSLNLNARNAGGGIGAAGGSNAIDVAVTNLTVNTNNGGAFVTDTGTLNFGPGMSHVGTGAIGVTTTGQITQSGAITQAAGGGAVSFTTGAAPITLTRTDNDFTGAVSLNNSGANAVQITDASALQLGTSSVGGALGVSAATTITQAGALTLSGGAATFTSTGGGAVTLSSIAGGGQNVTVNTSGLTTVSGTISGIGTLTTDAPGTVSLTGPIGAASLSINEAAPSICGSIGTGGGAIGFAGAVTLCGDTTLSATSATFGSTIDSAAGNRYSLATNLTGTFSSGAIGATDALSALSVTGGTTITTGSIRTAGGAAQAGGNVTLSGSGVLVTAAIDTTGGNATNAAAGAGGNVTITGGDVDVAAITSDGGTASNGPGGNAGTIALAATDGTPTITLSGDLNSRGGTGQNNPGGDGKSISFTAPVTLSADVTLRTRGGTGNSQGADGAASGSAAITGPGRTLTLDLGTADATFSNAGNNFGTVAVTAASNVTLRDQNAIVLGASTVGGSLSVTAGGLISQSGALSVTGDATFDTRANPGIGSVTLVAGPTITAGNSNVGGHLIVQSTAGDIHVPAGKTVTVAGTIDADAAGSIIVDGTVISGGTRNLRAPGGTTITLGADTDISALTLPSTGGITINLTSSGSGTGAPIAAQAISLTDGANSFGGQTIVNTAMTGGSTAAGTYNLTQSAPVTLGPVQALTITDTGGTAGKRGNVTLADAGNNFSSVAFTGGDLQLRDANALTLGTTTAGAGTTSTGTVFARAGGNLTLAGNVSAAATGDALTLVAGTSFNNPGSHTLSASSGRWLVYSTDPASDIRGGLQSAYDFKQYGLAYPGPYAGPGSGNGLIYSITPNVTPALSGTATRVYDGTVTAPAGGLAVSPAAGVIDSDTVTLAFTSASYDTRHVGTNKVVTADDVTIATQTNAGRPVYGYTTGSSASASVGEITPAPLTVTAQTDIRGYDGTTASSAAPLVSGTRYDPIATAAIQTFDTRHVGMGKTLTPSGLVVNDGNPVGSNYAITYVPVSTGEITPAPLTVTAQTDTRGYNGTTASSLAPLVSGTLYDPVATAAIQTFDTRHVGMGKTLTPSGLVVNDGNPVGSNYAITYVPVSTGEIIAAPLTVTAQTDIRGYDGTTASSAAPLVSGTLYDPVATAAIQTFDTRHVGTGKTLTPSGLVVNDGHPVGSNYAITYVPVSTGEITPAPLTVTADDKNRPVLTPNPPFTATYSGFVPGEGVTDLFGSLIFTTPAGTASPVGAYAITPSGQSAVNYSITYVNGTLTIIGTDAPTPPAPLPPSPGIPNGALDGAYQEAVASTRQQTPEAGPSGTALPGRVYEVQGTGIRLPAGLAP